MPTPIFVSPPASVPRWEITYHNDDLSLIRFVKWGRTTKLLDQVARWSGNRWDPSRWVPTAQADAEHRAAGGAVMTYPLTTTLNRIWACNPCDEGKERALKASGKAAPDDEPITYQQIVEAVRLDDALWCCRVEPQYDREWRLFAVWCARQVQHLMSDQRSIDALDVAERYAHGEATDEQLAAARDATMAVTRAAGLGQVRAAAAAAGAAAAGASAGVSAWAAARASAGASAWAAVRDPDWAAWDAAWDAARAAQRNAFIQLITTGELPNIMQQEVQ